MKAQRVTLRGARRHVEPMPSATLATRLSAAAPFLLAGFVVCLLIGGLIYLPNILSAYPIQSVQVEGVKDIRRQKDMQMALEELVSNENFFSAPLNAIYRHALSLDWIKGASVYRRWPDKIVLQVTEKIPVAIWNDDALVSTSGRKFFAKDMYSMEGLPRMSGPQERLLEVMNYYHSITKLLAPIGLAIEGLSVDARLTVRLRLSNGMQVLVDRSQYEEKLRRFIHLYEIVLEKDSRGLRRIDLRYGDGVAVQWKNKADPKLDERA